MKTLSRMEIKITRENVNNSKSVFADMNIGCRKTISNNGVERKNGLLRMIKNLSWSFGRAGKLNEKRCGPGVLYAGKQGVSSYDTLELARRDMRECDSAAEVQRRSQRSFSEQGRWNLT